MILKAMYGMRKKDLIIANYKLQIDFPQIIKSVLCLYPTKEEEDAIAY